MDRRVLSSVEPESNYHAGREGGVVGSTRETAVAARALHMLARPPDTWHDISQKFSPHFNSRFVIFAE